MIEIISPPSVMNGMMVRFQEYLIMNGSYKAAQLVLNWVMCSSLAIGSDAISAAENIAQVPDKACHTADLTAGIASRFYGHLRPVQVVDLYAQSTGVVTSQRVSAGSSVSASELLFEIDPTPHRIALKAAKAHFNAAKANLSEKKEKFTYAQQLFEKGAISWSEMVSLKTAYFSAQAEYDHADAQVQLAAYSLELSYIKAPIPGRIQVEHVVEGQFVEENRTKLATVVREEELFVDFMLPAEKFLDVFDRNYQLKNDVCISVEGASGIMRRALSASADSVVSPQSAAMLTRVSVAGLDRAFVPGEYVTIHITSANAGNGPLDKR